MSAPKSPKSTQSDTPSRMSGLAASGARVMAGTPSSRSSSSTSGSGEDKAAAAKAKRDAADKAKQERDEKKAEEARLKKEETERLRAEKERELAQKAAEKEAERSRKRAEHQAAEAAELEARRAADETKRQKDNERIAQQKQQEAELRAVEAAKAAKHEEEIRLKAEELAREKQEQKERDQAERERREQETLAKLREQQEKDAKEAIERREAQEAAVAERNRELQAQREAAGAASMDRLEERTQGAAERREEVLERIVEVAAAPSASEVINTALQEQGRYSKDLSPSDLFRQVGADSDKLAREKAAGRIRSDRKGAKSVESDDSVATDSPAAGADSRTAEMERLNAIEREKEVARKKREDDEEARKAAEKAAEEKLAQEAREFAERAQAQQRELEAQRKARVEAENLARQQKLESEREAALLREQVEERAREAAALAAKALEDKALEDKAREAAKDVVKEVVAKMLAEVSEGAAALAAKAKEEAERVAAEAKAKEEADKEAEAKRAEDAAGRVMAIKNDDNIVSGFSEEELEKISGEVSLVVEPSSDSTSISIVQNPDAARNKELAKKAQEVAQESPDYPDGFEVVSDPEGAKNAFERIKGIIEGADKSDEEKAAAIAALMSEDDHCEDTALRTFADVVCAVLDAEEGDVISAEEKEKALGVLTQQFGFLGTGEERDEEQTLEKMFEAFKETYASDEVADPLKQVIADAANSSFKKQTEEQKARAAASGEIAATDVLDEDDKKLPKPHVIGGSDDEDRFKQAAVVAIKAAVAITLCAALPGVGFLLALTFLYCSKNIAADKKPTAEPPMANEEFDKYLNDLRDSQTTAKAAGLPQDPKLNRTSEAAASAEEEMKGELEQEVGALGSALSSVKKPAVPAPVATEIQADGKEVGGVASKPAAVLAGGPLAEAPPAAPKSVVVEHEKDDEVEAATLAGLQPSVLREQRRLERRDKTKEQNELTIRGAKFARSGMVFTSARDGLAASLNEFRGSAEARGGLDGITGVKTVGEGERLDSHAGSVSGLSVEVGGQGRGQGGG